MPKEQIRKRGKRKPKNQEDAPAGHPAATGTADQPSTPSHPHHGDEEIQAGPSSAAAPSGIHPARAALLAGRRPNAAEMPAPRPVEDEQVLEWARTTPVDAEFPFGVLDPDLKAYFRNVDDQIRDWEGVSSAGEEREDRQTFLSSVLAELRGHELTVSTDPDTAVVLERLMPSLGDWGRRVIGDAFGDSWATLIRHRFGSHVVQTWFTLAADTLDRESRGVYPPQQAEQEQNPAQGKLPTMTDLFAKVIGLLSPSLSSLLTNPHASPPIRLLFVVLTATRAVPSLDANEENLIRSKKSGKYRKGQSVKGKSILTDGEGEGDEEKGKGKKVERGVPDVLVDTRRETLDGLRQAITPVEWRSMGINPVGSAAVQLLLELEVEDKKEKEVGSLLDILTDGLVNELYHQNNSTPAAQSYPNSLLTSPTGTRLLETVLSIAPLDVFQHLWRLYFAGSIGRYAGHPFDNFVVAKGVSRLDAEALSGVVRECRAVAGARGLIKTARTSVLQALVDRAKTVTAVQKDVLSLIQSALDLPDAEKKQLVPTLMALKTWPVYQALKTGKPITEDAADVAVPEEAVDPEAEEAAAAQARLDGWKNRRNPKAKEGDLAPNMQGCLLLQAMVGLLDGNVGVLESLLAQDVSLLLEYASSPVASHFLDAVLTSAAVSPKYRRRLLTAFMGHYRQLAEDRMGSRVADTIWAKADGFMKEKIARSLIHDANALASSQFGRFLANRIDLHLLERRPDEWRVKHLGVTGGKAIPAPVAAAAFVAVGKTAEEDAKDKRKRKEDRDAIDDLFADVDKKPKKSKSRA